MKITGPTTLPHRHWTAWEWVWKSAISGLSGSTASTALMYLKAKAGILPSFQPYESFQMAAGYLIGHAVHPKVLWLISFFNGSTAVGLVFGYLYRYLPGGSGVSKGMIFGLCGWLVMNLVAFPLVGLGSFATAIGLGFQPAAFSLAMLSTYSVVMGLIYGLLERSGKPG
jgi:hypothetical protein